MEQTFAEFAGVEPEKSAEEPKAVEVPAEVQKAPEPPKAEPLKAVAPKTPQAPMKTTEGGLLIGSTFEEQFRVARAYCASGILPQSFNTPEKVLVGMQFALELGLKPLTALRQIAVVNGNPSLWGDMPLSLVMQSGKLQYIREYWTDEQGKKICAENDNLGAKAYGAVCSVRRVGMEDECVRSFTLEDARVAGLLNKNPWKAYPKRMLQCRARAWALKDTFPDALNGAPIAEYDYDYIPESDRNGAPALQRDGAATLNDRFKKRAETIDAEVVDDKNRDTHVDLP